MIALGKKMIRKNVRSQKRIGIGYSLMEDSIHRNSRFMKNVMEPVFQKLFGSTLKGLSQKNNLAGKKLNLVFKKKYKKDVFKLQ